MRRATLVLVVILVAVQLLTFPVFAADDDEPGWLGSILSSIGQFITNAVEYLLAGLKALFIPRDDFFPEMWESLHSAFEKKFGGILSLISYLSDRFSNLAAYRGDLLVLEYPQDHLFSGRRVYLLSGSEAIASFIRVALTGVTMVFTAIFGYKKVAEIIRS